MRTLQLILIGILIMCFSSCYTAKKAKLQVDKADSHYPEVVAKLARDKYPCTELLRPDTLVTFKDSLVFVEVECPDIIKTETVIKIDTVNNVITKTIRIPVTLPVQIRTVTRWYEDSAKLKIYDVALNKSNQKNEKLQASNEKQGIKISRKNKELWIWRAIALCLIAWKVWKFYRRLTTVKVS